MGLFDEIDFVEGFDDPLSDESLVYAKPAWEKHNDDLCVAYDPDICGWRYAHVKRRNRGTYTGHVTISIDFLDSSPSHHVRTSSELGPIGELDSFTYEGEHTVIKKENKMSNKNVNYTGKDYNIVACMYKGNVCKSYSFKIDTSIEVVEGDLVVVEDSSGYNLVEVDAVYTIQDSHKSNEAFGAFNAAKAWVVNKVDTTALNQRRDRTNRKKLILRKLEEAKEEMEETAIWEALASRNPQAKALLEQLKELD